MLRNQRIIDIKHMIFILFIIGLFWFVFNSINHAKIITQDTVLRSAIVAAIEIFSLLILFFFLKLTDSSVRQTLKLNCIKLRILPSILLISLGIILLNFGLRPILYDFLPGKDLLVFYKSLWPTTTNHLVVFSIDGIIIAPIFEELLFRGMILSSIGNKWGYTLAITITSILFGILHVIPTDVVLIIIFSIILGLSVYITGSVLSSIIMHSLMNIYKILFNTFALNLEIIPPINIYLYLSIISIIGILIIFVGFYSLKKNSRGGTLSV